ncbi:MAG: tetratricopeptide repeat protein [Chloroflexaceae bacterium]|nr:tetratricopeptide repeat protein [Chloroflexaceae bacterium]
MKRSAASLLATPAILALLGLGFSGPANAQLNSPGQLNQPGSPSLNELLRQGWALVEGGDYGSALQIYEQAARLAPENPKIHSGIGFLHARQGSYGEAIRAYQQAVSLDPNNADFHHALGYSLASNRDHVQAAAAYRRAIGLQPNSVKHYLGLGVVLLRQEDFGGASEIFRRVLQLDPNHEAAREVLAMIFLKQGQLSEATAFCSKRSPNFPATAPSSCSLPMPGCNGAMLTPPLVPSKPLPPSNPITCKFSLPLLISSSNSRIGMVL